MEESPELAESDGPTVTGAFVFLAGEITAFRRGRFDRIVRFIGPSVSELVILRTLGDTLSISRWAARGRNEVRQECSPY